VGALHGGLHDCGLDASEKSMCRILGQIT
jgi:hypothetical protein